MLQARKVEAERTLCRSERESGGEGGAGVGVVHGDSYDMLGVKR